MKGTAPVHDPSGEDHAAGAAPPGAAAYLARGLGAALVGAAALALTEVTYSLSQPAALTGAGAILLLFLTEILTLGALLTPVGLLLGGAGYAIARFRRRGSREPRSGRRLWGGVRLGLGCAIFIGSIAAYVVNASEYVRLYHEIHQALTVAIAVSLCASVVLITWGRPPLRAVGRRTRLALWLAPLAMAAAIGAVHLVVTQRPTLKAFAFGRTTVLAHALELIGWAGDFDGDGYSAILGRGDCDEGSAARSPAAVEVVGNGIDENCSGADLSASALAATRAALAPHRAGHRATRQRRPWNVILVTVDALRWDRVDQIARPPTAPWLQTAARRGVFFTRAYAASTWTNASVYALMTSRYYSQVRWTPIAVTRDNRILIDRRPPGAIRGLFDRKKRMLVPIFDRSATMAEILAGAGYETATFPSYLFFLRNAGLVRGFRTVDSAPYHALARVGPTGESAAVIDRAVAFMKRMQSEGKRFFTWLHLMDPHHPYIGPGGSAKERYDHEVRRADRRVGRLLQFLQRSGLRRETIIILSADHGEELRDHGGEYHGTTLYEEVLRVPLIFLVPLAKPRLVGGSVSQIDVLPTVLELLGLDRPPDLMGRSLAPWIDGLQGPAPEHPVLAETFRFQSEKRALIESNYKLIYDRRFNGIELYDLRTDWRETRNLAEDLGVVAEKMRERLVRYSETLELDGLARTGASAGGDRKASANRSPAAAKVPAGPGSPRSRTTE